MEDVKFAVVYTDEDEDEYLKFGCDCGDRHSCQELEAKGDLENK